MTVTAVRLINVTSSISESSERTHQLEYEVETDSTNDGPFTVRTAAGIPDLYSTFSYGNEVDAGAVCVSKNVRIMSPRNDYTVWNVSCTFNSKIGSAQTSTLSQGLFPQSPVDYPAVWSGSFTQFQTDVFKDKDGQPIENYVGDRYIDPPVTKDDSRPVLIVEKNFSSAQLPTWSSYRDKVNSGTWWGMAARTLKIQQVAWRQLYYKNTPYISVRFEFHVNPDTWDVEVLNAGLREVKSGASEWTRIKDSLGREVTTPWPLHVTGRAMTQAEVSAGADFDTYKLYDELDFSTIGLPAVVGGA